MLVAALLMSTALASITMTWARHAVMARKTLSMSTGASESEESVRSAIERVRERMLDGDRPGSFEHEGDPDEIDTINKHHVTSEVDDEKHHHEHGGECHCKLHYKLHFKVKARKEEHHDNHDHDHHAHHEDGHDDKHHGDEYTLKAKVHIRPCSGKSKIKVHVRTRLKCEHGNAALLGSQVTEIHGNVKFEGTDLDGLFLVEEGATLTLQDVVLNGAILTRAGLCEDYLPIEGLTRPRVEIHGDFRLKASGHMPDVAVMAPDCHFHTHDDARFEIKGFVSADELKLHGKGVASGMLVSGSLEDIDIKIKRHGHGRGHEDWPESIQPGLEEIVRIAFPVAAISEAILDAMQAFHPDA